MIPIPTAFIRLWLALGALRRSPGGGPEVERLPEEDRGQARAPLGAKSGHSDADLFVIG